jgi:hypothetical protein
MIAHLGHPDDDLDNPLGVCGCMMVTAFFVASLVIGGVLYRIFIWSS